MISLLIVIKIIYLLVVIFKQWVKFHLNDVFYLADKFKEKNSVYIVFYSVLLVVQEAFITPYRKR